MEGGAETPGNEPILLYSLSPAPTALSPASREVRGIPPQHSDYRGKEAQGPQNLSPFSGGRPAPTLLVSQQILPRPKTSSSLSLGSHPPPGTDLALLGPHHSSVAVPHLQDLVLGASGVRRWKTRRRKKSRDPADVKSSPCITFPTLTWCWGRRRMAGQERGHSQGRGTGATSETGGHLQQAAEALKALRGT